MKVNYENTDEKLKQFRANYDKTPHRIAFVSYRIIKDIVVYLSNKFVSYRIIFNSFINLSDGEQCL